MAEEDFKVGLCSLCHSPGNLMYAWCCPPCAAATARSHYDTSDCCFNCMCLTLPLTRNIIREGYGLKGHFWGDVCISMMCGCCAINQLLCEVDERGKVNGPAPGSDQWKVGLCDCCAGGFWRCCYSFSNPFYAAASARTMYDMSEWLMNAGYGMPCVMRNIIREGYGIEGNCMGDCALGTFCPCCSAAQIYNEAHIRGPSAPRMERLIRQYQETHPGGATMTR
jgi:Cys-rich protein (TIGR01571 family)